VSAKEHGWTGSYVTRSRHVRDRPISVTSAVSARACVRSGRSPREMASSWVINQSGITSRLVSSGKVPIPRGQIPGSGVTPPPPPPPPLHDDGENNRSLGPAWIWFVGFFASSCDLRCLALPCSAGNQIYKRVLNQRS
jgi:hypothetical protein